MITSTLTELIGHTPLLDVSGWVDHRVRLLLKLEAFNPGGSVKDRAALSMIDDAIAQGILQPGATIIEPTSGNTGVGLAWIAAARGYRAVFCMPETMSVERRKLLAAYGAEIVLTPGSEGMPGAIRRAEELRAATPGAVILGQFSNPANPAAHRITTGEEIWTDTCGHVDVFVAGVGTGGTISGVGQCLKSHNEAIRIIAVEPATSPVLSGGTKGPHAIQGIGAGFVPDNFDRSVVDLIMRVTDDEARQTQLRLAREHGFLAGISSGAATAAALHLATMPDYQGKTIVALLPDTGERYLSLL